MPSVQPTTLPASALLHSYLNAGAYTDCYTVDMGGTVTLPEFIVAFYTTPLFKLERTLLGWFAARPSTDMGAKQLAEGLVDSFAVWHVEARESDQLLLADFSGRTKSWLMIETVQDAGTGMRTRLYFGSAVVPQGHKQSMNLAFHVLSGLHKLYSKLLLAAARSRIVQVHRSTAS